MAVGAPLRLSWADVIDHAVPHPANSPYDCAVDVELEALTDRGEGAPNVPRGHRPRR
jgi:hypothetical protein